MLRTLLVLSVAILLAAGCAPLVTCPKCPEPPKPPATEASYVERSFAELPGWASDSHAASLAAFLVGCPRLEATAALARACELARAVPAADDDAARAFFEATFAPFAVIAPEGSDEGLITGYYEPIIAGRREPEAGFRYPVFGVPEDLVVVDLASVQPETRHLRLRGRLQGRRLVPYHTRAEIDGRAHGSPAAPALPAPVLAWVADPVELFFLHIQGSGQIELASGERLRVGYADQNGHPYRSLGRHLVERGELTLEEATMPGIKAWAAANPARLREALNSNSSYVFFRELAPADGPIGALGVPLSAERSLAIDRRHVPLGAPVYLATTWPVSEQPLERLMVAQDTGGAIRGAVRADFYWGTGAQAGFFAGRMRQRGRLWVLWPRGEPFPRPR